MFDFSDTLTPAKQQLSVLILGSYSDPCYDKLQILRSELRECGYQNASLVADHTQESKELRDLEFTDYPLYTYKKSIQWIEKSGVNLFVFFKDCPFGSVISEMIISILKFKQFTCSTFFFEEGIEFDSVPMGFLSEYNMKIRHFDDLEDLIRMSKHECRDHIIDNKCE